MNSLIHKGYYTIIDQGTKIEIRPILISSLVPPKAIVVIKKGES